MRKSLGLLGFALVVATVPCSARADDRWELGSSNCANDDGTTTCNELFHGQKQTHDVQAVSPARDQDWMIVETQARHSYEVRLFGMSTAIGRFPPAISVTGTAERVDGTGALLTPSTGPDGTVNFGDVNGNLAIRWVGGSTKARSYIRVEGKTFGDPSANDQYEIELLDTTYDIPRWNQTGSQVTVFLLRNTTQAAVAGTVFFFDGAGTLVTTVPLSIPVDGTQAINTATIPALAEMAGSASIAHTGGYGAIAGKAVALEPSTGFTFDTPVLPVPR